MPSVRDTLIFFIIGCIVLGFGLWMIRWRLRVQSWERVSGRLVSKEITKREASGDTTYLTVARYQYIGGGRELTGERLRFDGQGGSKHSPARMMYDRLPEVGGAIDVWFDPATPEEAVLDPTLQWSTYGIALLGAIFVLGSLAPWIIRTLGLGK
jgi:hypothetical protein